jgi:hypothetical protein
LQYPATSSRSCCEETAWWTDVLLFSFPTDIVELRSGYVVPADVRLLPSPASHPWCSLVTDRSALYPASRRFFHHTAEGAASYGFAEPLCLFFLLSSTCLTVLVVS